MSRSRGPEHIVPVHRFLWVLAALLALLAISAGSALLKLGAWNPIINLAVSVTKTLLVMAVFMHETEARQLTRLVSALGFIWLSMLIGLALADFLTRSPLPPPW
ncbi:MAG TPA: cytochrome C oxidase subunit IV family protein [Steroidobacteraceae bacterium]|jgi:cytochrome c oxidase subunit 4